MFSFRIALRSIFTLSTHFITGVLSEKGQSHERAWSVFIWATFFTWLNNTLFLAHVMTKELFYENPQTNPGLSGYSLSSGKLPGANRRINPHHGPPIQSADANGDPSSDPYN